MTRARLIAVVAAVVLGAAAGAIAFASVYGFTAGVRFEMDRDLPGTVTGFFPVEHDGPRNFAWTGRTAALVLPDVNRRVPWVCTATLLGWRPEGTALPVVRFTVDGVEALAWQIRGAEDNVRIEVPARGDVSGLTLALAVSDTFRPKDDPRDLGIAVDRLACAPADGRAVLPPGPAWLRAAAGPAVLGAAMALAGLPLALTLAGAGVVAVVQAWPLALGMAPYVNGHPPVLPLALALGFALVLATTVLDLGRTEKLSAAARAALALSAVACYLKLIVLLHADMPAMDAVFQAHRLEWVLGGRYYFTSLTPDGYQFPYGISLYLAAAPFAALMRDHVALLRVVVCVAEMLAGLGLYTMAARAWNDRLAGVVAVLLFHTTPIAAGVVGTANLTNAFGESAALLTVTLVAMLPLTAPIWAWIALPTLAAAVAFIAHFSTFIVLSLTLCAIGLVYSVLGGPSLRRVASGVMLGLGLAMIVSILAFYGHFWSTYRTQVSRLAGEVRTIVAAPQTSPALPPGERPATPQPPAQAAASAPQAPPSAKPAPRRLRLSLGDRIGRIGRNTKAAYGWALMLLAALGLFTLITRRLRDRVSLAVAGWLVTLIACTMLAAATPLEMRYHLAVAPALTLLAGLAAATWWRAAGWRRWLMAAAVLAAVVDGMRSWFIWVL